MLGAGEKGLPRGPATATERHKRAFEPEGVVLLAVHSRCVLCCLVSLGTRTGRGGAGCWVLGREACQEGQLQRPRGTKGLSNLRVSSYLPCTPAACFVALAASAQACVWQGRRFRKIAYLLLKTSPGCCSHTNSYNQVRGHMTGSSHSGAEEYPRGKHKQTKGGTRIYHS